MHHNEFVVVSAIVEVTPTQCPQRHHRPDLLVPTRQWCFPRTSGRHTTRYAVDQFQSLFLAEFVEDPPQAAIAVEVNCVQKQVRVSFDKRREQVFAQVADVQPGQEQVVERQWPQEVQADGSHCFGLEERRDFTEADVSQHIFRVHESVFANLPGGRQL